MQSRATAQACDTAEHPILFHCTALSALYVHSCVAAAVIMLALAAVNYVQYNHTTVCTHTNNHYYYHCCSCRHYTTTSPLSCSSAL
eukprot:13103-Heterococcus_DN1.PRE.4